MKTSPSKLAVLLGTLALCACRHDPLGSTGVQVDLLTGDSRIYATYFLMSWMDEQNQLFLVRVPEAQGAFIDAEQAPAVSVFIALDPGKAGVRRLLVRGYRDDVIISEGAARLPTAPNVWVQFGLNMKPAGSLPDQDGDGLPDAVDNCPRERDPCTGTPPPEVDAGVDAGDPDAAPDAGPDLAPDLPVERPPVMPTNIPDAAPDMLRRDLRPS
jgi:hypothetical protein